MELASEMKNLSEEIISSFKQRIKENEELVTEVQKTLEGFQKGHQEMSSALRKGLATNEKERLQESDDFMKGINNVISKLFADTQTLLTEFSKEHQGMAVALRSDLNKDEKIRIQEFIHLMKSINEEISEIFTYTHDLLAKFNKEHKEMATALRSDLDAGEKTRMTEFVALMKSINEEISRIFTFTHDLLAKFDKEHQDMAVALKSGLAEGEETRLKEFNEVMKGIRNNVKDLKTAVAELLGDYAQDRGEVSAAWKKMTEILAQLRKTGVTPPKKVEKKVEKKEAKEEIPAEKAKETSVEAKPAEKVMEAPLAEPAKKAPETPVKTEPKPVVPITLEEKILNYIYKHPKGVKISQMEKPIGETRMKLGYIAKNLLDAGKVQKVDNIYFPLKK